MTLIWPPHIPSLNTFGTPVRCILDLRILCISYSLVRIVYLQIVSPVQSPKHSFLQLSSASLVHHILFISTTGFLFLEVELLSFVLLFCFSTQNLLFHLSF